MYAAYNDGYAFEAAYAHAKLKREYPLNRR